MSNREIIIRKEFVAEIKTIIGQARESAIRSVDFQRVLMYWHIGQRIFEEEQQGKERAEYGTYLPDQESGKRTGTGVWERLFGKDFRDQSPVLQNLSKCEHTVFAIELEPIPSAA